MKIAGLDIGTTGCKLSVFDENGVYLDRSYRDYPSIRGDEQQIDASLIKAAVYEVCQDMGQKYPDIAGIGVTSFGETFVLTDGEGNVLLPSMLYTDPRGKEQCKRLKETLGEETIETSQRLKTARDVFLAQDYVGEGKPAGDMGESQTYLLSGRFHRARLDRYLPNRLFLSHQDDGV